MLGSPDSLVPVKLLSKSKGIWGFTGEIKSEFCNYNFTNRDVFQLATLQYKRKLLAKHHKCNYIHRKLQQEQESPKNQQTTSNSVDCLPCRISGGVIQLGIAGFLASHYEQMKTKNARIGLIVFSSGKFFFY